MLASRRRTPWGESPAKQKKDFREGNPSFLVEAAGLEPTVSSTRNWRDTTFATPRICKLKVENGKLKVNFVVVSYVVKATF